jgi:hypothetical protein
MGEAYKLYPLETSKANYFCTKIEKLEDANSNHCILIKLAGH